MRATRTKPVLAQALKVLNKKTGNDWDYRLFPIRQKNGTIILTGLAWNKKRVQAIGRPFRVPVKDVTPNKFFELHRQPHAMKFSEEKGERISSSCQSTPRPTVEGRMRTNATRKPSL